MDIVINDATNKNTLSLDHYYLNALLCLGGDSQYPPLADLLCAYHRLEGTWLIASPIHWQATHNDALISAGGEELLLSEEEARLWFAAVAEFLQPEGFTAVYHHTTLWLFRLNQQPDLISPSLQAVMHQSMMPILITLDPSLFWQRLLTEVQMVMSQHELNQYRANTAKPAINGLWFWGMGKFQPKNKGRIFSDDPVFLENPYFSSSAVNLSNHFLSASPSFHKKDIVLINSLQSFDLKQLEQSTKKLHTHWYWNNLNYVKRAKRWWLGGF